MLKTSKRRRIVKKSILALMIVALVLFFTAYKASATEIDILVTKLVEKGILTPGEAQQIVTETKEEIRTNAAAGKDERLPSWVQKMDFGGDLRLRYERRSRKGESERHRFRTRLRAGVDSKVTDQVNVGFGIATGSDDPRSTNATWDSTFDTLNLMLDYAYAEYAPTDWASVIGGKWKRKWYIYEPSDLLWDGDINPEGGAVKINRGIADGVDFFASGGAMVLDEASSDTSDPWLWYIQPGIAWDITDNVDMKFAAAYYDFENVKGAILDHSEHTNTVEDTGFAHRTRANMPMIYDYNCINLSTELGFNEPFGGFDGMIPYTGVFGEWVHNTDVSENENGYIIGCKIGDKKVKKNGQWQLKYMYRRLETDAWIDALPDSDVWDGYGTNLKAHEVSLKYGLAKNWTLGFDYYYSQPIDIINEAPYTYFMNPDDVEHLFQTDLVFKF
jgi:polyhydroxyalkanoate synthesis regulator phasin